MTSNALLLLLFYKHRETTPLSLSGGMCAMVSRITPFGHQCRPETTYDHKGVSR